MCTIERFDLNLDFLDALPYWRYPSPGHFDICVPPMFLMGPKQRWPGTGLLERAPSNVTRISWIPSEISVVLAGHHAVRPILSGWRLGGIKLRVIQNVHVKHSPDDERNAEIVYSTDPRHTVSEVISRGERGPIRRHNYTMSYTSTRGDNLNPGGYGEYLQESKAEQ